MNGLYAGIFTSCLLKTEPHSGFCSDCLNLSLNKNRVFRDLPRGPVVKTVFSLRGTGVDPWLGNKDPTCHLVWPKINKRNLSQLCGIRKEFKVLENNES